MHSGLIVSFIFVLQLASGGAIYSTSTLTLAGSGRSPGLSLARCSLRGNSAQMQGGAVAVQGQALAVIGCAFSGNLAGDPTELFSDTPAAGGALWFSGQQRQGAVSNSTFEG